MKIDEHTQGFLDALNRIDARKRIMQETLFDLPNLELPKEFIGDNKTPGGYTKTQPREWTKEEIDWLLERKKEGYSIKELATAMDRSDVSVSIKLKRLGKSNDTYNQSNRSLKYETNEKFINFIKPKSVLDLFAGNSFYNKYSDLVLEDNDIDKKFKTKYHENSLRLLCKFFQQNKKFDVIDLDPYGSAYECFDLAIKMAKNGIVISFGEWGHKRWRRYDYVRPRYGIKNDEEFTEDAFLAEVKRIATLNHKELEVVYEIKYSNFYRVYFKINKLKITEQWNVE